MEKGLEKLKKQELIDIILRKDSVEEGLQKDLKIASVTLKSFKARAEELNNAIAFHQAEVKKNKEMLAEANKSISERNDELAKLRAVIDTQKSEIFKRIDEIGSLKTDLSIIKTNLEKKTRAFDKAKRWFGYMVITNVILVVALIVAIVL